MSLSDCIDILLDGCVEFMDEDELKILPFCREYLRVFVSPDAEDKIDSIIYNLMLMHGHQMMEDETLPSFLERTTEGALEELRNNLRVAVKIVKEQSNLISEDLDPFKESLAEYIEANRSIIEANKGKVMTAMMEIIKTSDFKTEEGLRKYFEDCKCLQLP